ncbi:MAG: hypothetical protein REI96_06300 [Flavobacterium nitrogenifigens]|uniref:hypothetical protein n=1 Tax=Flavobacterium nitrogenifigens TaxID=1617283 RepID=UPI00280980E1|nr:hypothetical protein [Flavobacterium nitrogenifigens]MDQ8012038.1 hypothetical protein [Flavobacterium nitrogenifigens]
MKTFSEDELKDLANKIFAQYPDANQVFATVDGNIFLERNRADIHAGAKGRVLVIDRPIAEVSDDSKKDKNSTKLSAEDSIKAIALVETIEALEPFRADKRATVIKAVEDKIAELTKPTE